MPIETLLALLGIALIAFLALIVVSPAPIGERLRRALRRTPADEASLSAMRDADLPDDPASSPGDLRPAALYRVVRVATWVFIFAASTVVISRARRRDQRSRSPPRMVSSTRASTRVSPRSTRWST